jgi:hypothetical protein
MPVNVPVVTAGDDVTETWTDAVVAAIVEMQALTRIMGPSAVIMVNGWRVYGGGDNVHQIPQVTRFGRLVIMTGLAQNVSGAPIAYDVAPGNVIGHVPMGFWPRAVGVAAPLGGTIMATEYSNTATLSVRIHIGPAGGVAFSAATGGATNTVPNNGWISMQAAWETE